MKDKEQFIKDVKNLAIDFWRMNLHNGTFESNLRILIDNQEKI